MRRNSLLLLLYIVILQVLDAITTYIAIRNGAIELNPLVRLFAGDLVKLTLFKIVSGILIYLLIRDEGPTRAEKGLTLIIYSIMMWQAIIINLFNALL